MLLLVIQPYWHRNNIAIFPFVYHYPLSGRSSCRAHSPPLSQSKPWSLISLSRLPNTGAGRCFTNRQRPISYKGNGPLWRWPVLLSHRPRYLVQKSQMPSGLGSLARSDVQQPLPIRPNNIQVSKRSRRRPSSGRQGGCRICPADRAPGCRRRYRAATADRNPALAQRAPGP